MLNSRAGRCGSVLDLDVIGVNSFHERRMMAYKIRNCILNRVKLSREMLDSELRRNRKHINKKSTYNQIYDCYWRPELVAYCRNKCLKLSGKKKDLIDRILKNFVDPTCLFYFFFHSTHSCLFSYRIQEEKETKETSSTF